MHLCMIVDEERLAHEQGLISRLAIGLADEGIVVSLFLPEGAELTPSPELATLEEDVAGPFAIPMSVLPWMRRSRARQIAGLVDRTPIDVCWGIGTDAWTIALEVGAEVAAPVVIDLWCADQVNAAPRGRLARPIAAYVAPTEPIATALRERVDPGLVTVLRPGVGAPEQPRAIVRDGELLSIVIIGAGRDVASFRSLLRALSGLVRELPKLQAIIELRGPHAHDIWAEANRLDLLPYLSAITEAAPLRHLLTRCDVMICPERSGQFRSIVVEAMAQGMAIVAAEDPSMDLHTDGQTAALVGSDTSDCWTDQLRRVLLDGQLARDLGTAAHRLAAGRYPLRGYVDAVHDLLERVVIGDAYRFDAANDRT